MPTTTGYRGSTQDGTNGVIVAQAVDEVNSGNTLVSGVQEGNKTTYAETSRTGITAGDAPTGGDLTTTGFAGTSGANLFDAGNALNVAVRATSSTASATLTGRLIFYDGSNNPLGFSREFSFVSDPTLRQGNATGNFVAQVDMVDCNQARKAEFFVDTVSAGTWSIYCRPV
jgi:hypothetical protein